MKVPRLKFLTSILERLKKHVLSCFRHFTRGVDFVHAIKVQNNFVETYWTDLKAEVFQNNSITYSKAVTIGSLIDKVCQEQCGQLMVVRNVRQIIQNLLPDVFHVRTLGRITGMSCTSILGNIFCSKTDDQSFHRTSFQTHTQITTVEVGETVGFPSRWYHKTFVRHCTRLYEMVPLAAHSKKQSSKNNVMYNNFAIKTELIGETIRVFILPIYAR